MRNSHVIVPLLASSSPRKRSGFLRNLRKRLRIYILTFGLISIVTITIIHKSLINENNLEYILDESSTQTLKKTNLLFEPKAIKTITAKYVGPQPWWIDGNFNLSQTELDHNGYFPEPGAGNKGRPVYLKGLSKQKIDKSFSINKFNLIVSDKISVDRKLPDPRKSKCKEKTYNLKQLPNTSIIIVYHNEAWSTLVRTVHSILNNSPKELLAEVLLIDDGSNRKFLNDSFDKYMEKLSLSRGVSIKVIRSLGRVGLINARLLGSENAVGNTLTFIDAHCEATIGWLEPLMDIIHNNNKTAAVPVIDTISDETFAYKRTFDLHMGAFNWGLNFRWYPIPNKEILESNSLSTSIGDSVESILKSKQEFVAPVKTPAMAGGLFSIDKNFFYSIGTYDSNMDIWGAENIELSLRIWQCGGRILSAPCSHVAHLFRKSSPYTGRHGLNVAEIFNFNRVRLVEVWMDEWKNFVYSMNPALQDSKDKMSHELDGLKGIEERKQLKRELSCKSFAWYLDNVWPQNYFPTHDRLFGKLRHKETLMCIEKLTGNMLGLDLKNCSRKMDQLQSFVIDKHSKLILANDYNCLDVGSHPKVGREAFFTACIGHSRQQWILETNKSGKVIHDNSKLCLHYSVDSIKIILEECQNKNLHQEWELLIENWQQVV